MKEHKSPSGQRVQPYQTRRFVNLIHEAANAFQSERRKAGGDGGVVKCRPPAY